MSHASQTRLPSSWRLTIRVLGSLLLVCLVLVATRAEAAVDSTNTGMPLDRRVFKLSGSGSRSSFGSSSSSNSSLEIQSRQPPPQQQQQLQQQQQQQQAHESSTLTRMQRRRHRRRLQELCTCSPTVFSIRFDFTNDCSDDSLKNNDGGIRGTLCLLGEVDGGGGGEDGEEEDASDGDEGGGEGGTGGGQATDMPTDMPTYVPTPFTTSGGTDEPTGGEGEGEPTPLEPTAFPTTYSPTDPPFAVDDPFRPPIPPTPSDSDGDSETIDVGGGENEDLDDQGDGEEVVVEDGNATDGAVNATDNDGNSETIDVGGGENDEEDDLDGGDAVVGGRDEDGNATATETNVDGDGETIDVGGGDTVDDDVGDGDALLFPTYAPSNPWPTYNPWPTFSPTFTQDAVSTRNQHAGDDVSFTYAPSSPWPTYTPTSTVRKVKDTVVGSAPSERSIGTTTTTMTSHAKRSAPTPSVMEQYYGYHTSQNHPSLHHHHHRRRDLIDVDPYLMEVRQEDETEEEEETKDVPRHEQRPRIGRIVITTEEEEQDDSNREQQARIPHVEHPQDGWKHRRTNDPNGGNDRSIISNNKGKETKTVNDENRNNNKLERKRQRRQQQLTKQQRPQQRQMASSSIQSWTSIPPNDEFFARFPEFRAHQEELYRWRRGINAVDLNPNHSHRHLQQDSPIPTQLLSAQFLEIDTSPDMNIINQDDQYLNLTSSDAIDVLSFTSISSMLDPTLDIADQLNYVPGGAILILIGMTEEGEVVRNRLLWTYTNGCGKMDMPIFDGDEFGWAVFGDIEPARDEFCPAHGGVAPTPSPTVAEGTSLPTMEFSMNYSSGDTERTRELLDRMDLSNVRVSKKKASSNARRGGRTHGRKRMERERSKEEGERRNLGVEEEEFGRRIVSPVEMDEEEEEEEEDLGGYFEEVEFGRQFKQRRLRKQPRS